MKEVLSVIKSLWANKRTRSIAILIGYFFFFIFVYFFITANTSPSNPTVPLKGWEAFENTTKYHYQITMEEIVDVVYDQQLTMVYQDQEYHMETIPDHLKQYSISFWTPSNIKKIVEKATLVSTNYVENKDTYQLNSSEASLPWENVQELTIDVYKKEDTIYKIIIEQKDILFHLEWNIE